MPKDSAFIERIIPPYHADGSRSGMIRQKVLLSLIAVALGLLAWILTPILPLLLLICAIRLLPINGRARTGLLIFGCLSIGLGAALNTANLPSSEIAALKLLGPLFK